MAEKIGSFGSLLARHMRSRELSQQRLGKLAGLDHSMVSRLVSGQRQPSRETVGELAAQLNLTFPDTVEFYAAAGFLHPIVHNNFLEGVPVNVLDVMQIAKAQAELHPEPTPSTIIHMLELRREGYRGFAALEESRGFLLRECSLSSSKGQEIIRILIMRGIEELLEFADATDRIHKQEELIDAFNYFLSTAVMDPQMDWSSLSWSLALAFTNADYGREVEDYEVTGLVLERLHPFLSTLRNRPWQQHAQSLYFDGFPQLIVLLEEVARAVAISFASWEQFYTFFLAKHQVLEFRLRTQY